MGDALIRVAMLKDSRLVVKSQVTSSLLQTKMNLMTLAHLRVL